MRHILSTTTPRPTALAHGDRSTRKQCFAALLSAPGEYLFMRALDHDRVERALVEAERATAAPAANGTATPSDGLIERLVARLDQSRLW